MKHRSALATLLSSCACVFLLASFSRPLLAAEADKESLDTLAPGVLRPVEVMSLLKGKKFDELDALAAELRTGERRSPSGRWELHIMYAWLEQEAELKQLESWKKARPQSISARIALARCYIGLAWDARGSGYGSTVTDEGHAGMQKYLNAAMSELNEAEGFDEKDPDLYSSKIRAGMGLGLDGPMVDKYFKKGAEIAPTYNGLYTTYGNYLLPRWHGEPGDVEKFARRAARLTQEEEGEGFYARVAMNCFDYVGTPEFPATHEFDWPTLRRAFGDLGNLYPMSKTNLNYLALFATVYDDKKVATEAFKKIGIALDPSVWDSKPYFEAASAWAHGNGSNPGFGLLSGLIETGNVELIQRAIDEGLDPNERNVRGNPAMHVAIWDDHTDIALALIERGANLELTNDEGWTALGIAAGEGNAEVVRALLEAKADPSHVSNSGWTPLTNAIREKQWAIVELLLDAGADVNKVGKGTFTPLYEAVHSKNLPLAGRLLDAGAQPNIRVAEGWTPLLLAAQNADMNLVTLLLDHRADPNLANDGGMTPLVKACNMKSWDVARLLIEHKADPNIPENEVGWAALHCTAKEGSIETVKLLLEHGANPNQFGHDGWSPLLIAIRNKHSDIAMAMLDYPEIDVEVRNANGVSALHWAVRLCDKKVTQRLLELGADPASRAKDGSTPLGDTKIAKCPDLEPVLKKALQGK